MFAATLIILILNFNFTNESFPNIIYYIILYLYLKNAFLHQKDAEDTDIPLVVFAVFSLYAGTSVYKMIYCLNTVFKRILNYSI